MSRYYNPEELGKDLTMDAYKDLTYPLVKSAIYYPNSYSTYNLGGIVFHRIDGMVNLGGILFLRIEGMTNLGGMVFIKEDEE